MNSTLDWHLTTHAREKAVKRGYALIDVLLAAAQPEVTYQQSNRGPSAQIRQRGAIAVAVDIDTQTIITVLWRQSDKWTDTDTGPQLAAS